MPGSKTNRSAYLKLLNQKRRRSKSDSESSCSLNTVEKKSCTSQVTQEITINQQHFQKENEVSSHKNETNETNENFYDCEEIAENDDPFLEKSNETFHECNEITDKDDSFFDKSNFFCDTSSNEEEEEDSSDEMYYSQKKYTVNFNHDEKNHICTVIREKLRIWAIKFTVVHLIVSSILRILKEVLPCLPVSAKDLLKTENKFLVEEFNPDNLAEKSEFVYIGLAEQLKRTVNPVNHLEKCLKLQFNIDGLPLFRTGGIELWPILGRIYGSSNIYDPFIVAVYNGIGKPTLLNKYFSKFVSELNGLLHTGITIEDVHFEIKVMCITCDRPGRSFVKNIINHNGYYACERCEQEGVRIEKRTIFPSVLSVERTDQSFRTKTNKKHHNGLTPLLRISPKIDMIFTFPLDFMHLCCLGVMKKLMECWLTTVSDTMLSRINVLQLTQRVTNLSGQIPTEFQRQLLQSLGQISKWKATEFRFFLLYTGPILMKDLLPSAQYNHFMYFHVATRLLCSKKLCLKYASHAKDYLTRFVLDFAKFYTLCSLALNVHSLIHLADDVVFHGCSLSELTAFPFESTLGKIKKLIHSGKRPLQQLVRRLSEQFSICKEKPKLSPDFKILKIKKGVCKINNQITSFKYKDFTYCTTKPNNCVLLKNGSFILVDNIVGSNESDIYISGKKLNILGDVFDYPTKSSDLNIHKVLPGKEIVKAELRDIDVKALFLNIYELSRDEKKNYVVPLLH